MRKAFTLVELLITISLMGMLMCIFFPVSSSIKRTMDEKRFKGSSMELLEDMRHARVRAMTSGEVELLFTVDGYLLVDTYNKEIYKQVIFKKGIKIDLAASTIPYSEKRLKFSCSGSVSPYACSIVIIDNEGRSATISIKVATFMIDFKGERP